MIIKFLILDAATLLLLSLTLLVTTLPDGMVASLTLLAVVIGPLLVVWITAREARITRREQWVREDIVKTRDETLMAGQRVIHGLVNSNMTAALNNALVSYKALLVLQQADAVRLTADPATLPGLVTVAQNEAAATRVKVAELEAQLADRTNAPLGPP